MGFLSKAFKKVKKQIQPNNMMIGSLPKRPKRGGGFLSKIRNKAFDRIESGKIPARSGFLRGQYFGPRGNMGSDFRMPQKRSGFGFGLGEAIRRLNEQGGIGMKSDGIRSDPRRPSMPRIPQPIPERMPTDPISYYNSTIFGQPIPEGADFSNMPDFSQIDMSQLDIPTLPREISQMDLPQMPEGLPSMEDVQRMPQMGMNDMQPRRMMAGGDEVFMPSTPEQIAFSIEAEIKNLMNEYEMAANNGENERAMMLNEQINELEAQKIEVMNQGRPQLAEGDEVFPDLTGDGKVTQADILKGRGVYAEGDEVMMMQETDMMAPGNQEIEESLMEVQGMQPDMQVLDQYVQMVTQMIQAGASEAEVIESLRQAGLDDDDIAAVFQAVMETMQNSMEQGGIDSELAQLG